MPAAGKMAAPPPQTEQGIPQGVLAKLIIFAILMAVVPIGTYFISLNALWEGNTAYAAISAVLAANVVLAGYVYLAFAEDKQEREEEKKSKSQ